MFVLVVFVCILWSASVQSSMAHAIVEPCPSFDSLLLGGLCCCHLLVVAAPCPAYYCLNLFASFVHVLVFSTGQPWVFWYSAPKCTTKYFPVWASCTSAPLSCIPT